VDIEGTGNFEPTNRKSGWLSMAITAGLSTGNSKPGERPKSRLSDGSGMAGEIKRAYSFLDFPLPETRFTVSNPTRFSSAA